MGESVLKPDVKPMMPAAVGKLIKTVQKIQLEDIARRILDVVASGLGLIFLSPFFLLIGIAVRRESPGPMFYRGPRAGKDGQLFWILKFRTMYERPESYAGPRITAQGDNRITPLGHWLRNTKINELPQLWNVFKGEMSLVGPRPEDYDIAMEWPESIRREVLSVRPGITSPASVVYRNEESLLSQNGLMDDYMTKVLPSKLRLDLLYIRHRTVLSDLDVVFWTFIMLLPRIGKMEIPESLLIWGPLSHFFSRYANWFFTDSIVAFLALAISGIIWRFGEPLNLGWDLALVVGVAIAFLFSLCNQVLGLQNISWKYAPPRDAIKLALSASISVLIITLLDTLVFQHKLPVRMMAIAGAFAYAGFLVTRYRERLVTGLATRWINSRESARSLGEHVLIVGAGENGSLAAWMFQRNDFAQYYSIIGFVDDDPRKYGLKMEGYPVRGTTRDIPQLVKQFDVGLIIYTIEQISSIEQTRILDVCRQASVRVVMLPEMIRFLRAQVGIYHEDNPPKQNLSYLPSVSTNQVFLWLTAVQSAVNGRSWDGVETQLQHVRSELDRITDISQGV